MHSNGVKCKSTKIRFRCGDEINDFEITLSTKNKNINLLVHIHSKEKWVVSTNCLRKEDLRHLQLKMMTIQKLFREHHYQNL